MKFLFDPRDAVGDDVKEFVGGWLAVIIYGKSWIAQKDKVQLGACEFDGLVVTLGLDINSADAFSRASACAMQCAREDAPVTFYVVPMNKYRPYKAGVAMGGEDDSTSTVAELSQSAAVRAIDYELVDMFGRTARLTPEQALEEVREESVQDLLTDLMHLARHKGWFFNEILEQAQTCFEVES